MDRLPENVIHVAESLWLSCLDRARALAQQELRGEKVSLGTKHGEQAMRAKVMSLREQEVKARLADRDRTISILEMETKTFASLFKKEQAKSAAAAQRVLALQVEIDSLRKLLASLSIRTALKHRAVQSVKTPKLRKAA